MKQYNWKKALVSAASIFVFSTSSATDVTAGTTNSSPYMYTDPSATYQQVGAPVQEEASSLAFSNQQLGLASPIDINAGYSANYGAEVQASFAHMMGLYDAVSLLGAYASKENRIDITWAHAWTDNQRTKLGVERLDEKMDFDFDSGSTSQWIPQYSFGASYQYIFNQNWLRNVELSGYYANAQSQDLDTVSFQSNGQTYDNYRHIAGAISKGGEATLNVLPWVTGLVGLGLNYDEVTYDTKYQDTNAEDASGLGFTLSLEQLLSKHVKLNLEGSQREVYDDYVAGVSFLTPANLEIGVNGERTIGQNGSASDSRFNLNLGYFLDDNSRYKNGYNFSDVGAGDLAAWASKSPAYMDEVLAAADQKTVLVANGETPETKQLQSSEETAPVLNLTPGEVNHISIADYVAKLNLTDAQKESTPRIIGGPSEVEFTYDNATQSLVTKKEVSKNIVVKEFEPLVVVFPTENSELFVSQRSLLKNSDQLKFRVAIGVTSSTPSLNPNFQTNNNLTLGRAKTWTFYYENLDKTQAGNSTQAPDVMFINPAASSSLMLTDPKYITQDPTKCVVATTDWSTNKDSQNLYVTTTGGTGCPTVGGTVSLSVKGCNGSVCGATQTIKFTMQSASNPSVSGGAIKNPISNSSYSYPFSTAEVTAGEGMTFNSSQTYAKVYNAAGCVDVTSSFDPLVVGSTTVTLTSPKIPTSLSGANLLVYIHAVNQQGAVYDSGTTSKCGTTKDSNYAPFTATVQTEQIAPVIPANIPLDQITINDKYTYDFMNPTDSQFKVTTGSSDLDTTASKATIQVKDQSGTVVDDGTKLGLAVKITGTDVQLTGTPNPGFSGDTVYVTLNLTNEQGLSGNNNASPAFSKAIAVNVNDAPSVAQDQPITNIAQYKPYSHTFTTAEASPGTGEYFSTNSYAIVTDPQGATYSTQSQGSPFALNVVNNKSQVQLVSTGSNELTLQGQWKVELYVENVDQQTANNAGHPDTWTVTANSAYDPTVKTAGVPLTAAVVDPTNTTGYTYDYATTPMSPGPEGQVFDTTQTKALVYYKGTKTNPISGFSLEFNDGNTTITKLKADADTIQSLTGPVDVYYQAVNLTNPNDVITSTSPDTIGTDKIVVTNTTLTSGEFGNPYNYDFVANNNLMLGSTELGGSSNVVLSDPNAGLKATVTTNNIVISGTPTKTETITATLNLNTPDGLLPKTYETSIDISANKDYEPSVNTIGVPLTNAVVDNTNTTGYSYPYTTSPMLPGAEGQTFDTTQTKALVYYKGNKTQPISGFSLEFNAGKTAITALKADAATIQGLTGPVDVYYQAVNSQNTSYVVTSDTPDTIETDQIQIPTTTLDSATTGAEYNYSFAANNNLTLGSSGLDPNVYSVDFSDPNAGLSGKVTADGKDVVISGTPVSGHTGTITATLNLQTPDDGLLKKSIVTTITIIEDPAMLPNVAYDQTLTDGMQFKTYSHLFTTEEASPGKGDTFSADPALTYAIVKDPNGNVYNTQDPSGPFAISLANNDTQVQLSSANGGTLTLQNQWTVELHVANSHGLTATNAGLGKVDKFTVNENSDYNPVINTQGESLTNVIQDGMKDYLYAYTESPASPGPEGMVFDTDKTKALVYNAADGKSVSGFTLEFSDDKTKITGLKADSTTAQGLAGAVNVYYQVANTTNTSTNGMVTSTKADTIGTDKIVVSTTSLTGANVDSAYSYSFAKNNNLTLGSAGLDTDTSKSYVTFNGSLSGEITSGWSANITTSDVVISATSPSTEETVTATLHLMTPDGLLTESIDTTIVVGKAVPKIGYVACPLVNDPTGNNNDPYHRSPTSYANIYSASTGGAYIDKLAYAGSSNTGSPASSVYLARATLNGNTLTCNYVKPSNSNGLPDYVATATIQPSDGGVSAVKSTGWQSSTVCDASGTTQTETTCQVTYTI